MLEAMTKADKITMSRIFLAPIFFIIYIYHIFPALPTVVLLWLLFTVMEVSDLLDGQVARAEKKVSDFGKLFDPFADVLARTTYFLCFAWSAIMPLWILLIILYREFSILFLRMLLSSKGIAMGARPGGKLKAGIYMVSGTLALFHVSLEMLSVNFAWADALALVVQVGFIAAAFLSVASFIDYLVQFRKLMSGSKS